MRFLMLIWTEADAAGGGRADFDARSTFDQTVKDADAFVLNGALQPAAEEARLVQTGLAGHELDESVERRPFTEGKTQIEAFYIMDCIMDCQDIEEATR